MLLSALGKSLLSGRKKKKSKSGKEMSQQVLNRSSKEDEKLVIKPQNSLVPLSIKTTTIPTANLITTKEDSIKDKLVMIKDLLGLQLKLRVSSFSQRMKSMREERRKNREKELEENKQKKEKSPKFLNLLPRTGILDSLKNFLAFLAGGFLLNILLNNLPVLKAILKKLKPIVKGIMQFVKFLWDGVVGFIVKAYDGYDALRESIRKLGGDEAVEKFDKVAELLKKVINGAIIAATLALVARPFMPRRGGRGGGGPCPPCPPSKPCVCKVPDPKRVPSLETQLSSVTQLQTDAVRSPAFNWGRIFDPIRDILSALGKKKTNEEASGTAVQDQQPAYATESLTSAVTAYTESLAVVDKLLDNADERIPEVVSVTESAINPETDVYYTPEDFGDAAAEPMYIPLSILKGAVITGGKVISAIGALITSGGAVSEFAKGGTVPPISPMDKSYDDLATNTSYSQGSYGMITNTTTIIQPVVQEV
jgi:hypothetical protein